MMKVEQDKLEKESNESKQFYDEYQYTFKEKVIYTLLSFSVGGLVGFIFYGNLFMKDGELTLASYISNIVVFTLIGAVAVRIFLPLKKQQLIEKRKKILRLQFREMLSALSTAFSSGENVINAFCNVKNEMEVQFGVESDIVCELTEIVSGINNNKKIDEILVDFGNRSGVEDIKDFSKVFQVCFSKGGNLKQVVRNSYNLIGDKLAINEEIQTKITSNQMQQKVMSIVPIILIAFLRFSSSAFAASFASIKGVVAMTVAGVIFIISYLYGKKVTDIKG